MLGIGYVIAAAVFHGIVVVWGSSRRACPCGTVGAGIGGTDRDRGTRSLIVAVIVVAAGI